ncbi:MAG TPA: glycine zipper domain-containing protein [Tepidisphaeraceae bacterium]|nr:glycine zipper domain-containing protein [Tepidisphaeraceae bacterium]
MKRAVCSFLTATVLGAAVLGSSGGCETKAGTGALVGGAAGAGIGAIVGNNTGRGHTAGGALIGGAIGAIGGALVGNEMDKADREKERDRQYREERYYRDSGDRARRYESRAETCTPRDVVAWAQRGDRDADIIDRIDRAGVTFALSARDENHLRNAGVSEDVIRHMKDTARR